MSTFIPEHSTNEIYRDENLSRFLTTDLETIEDDISALQTGKADSTHTHSDYATTNHTHSGYASSGHTHTASEVGAAASNHSHSGYASSSHTHSGYASSSHTHTASEVGAAASSHTHSDYFAKTGGTISGDTNVDGVLRVKSNQAYYYNSTSATQTIGSNNATGGTTIANGTSANVYVNGANLMTPSCLPRATDTYYCGNANYRWKGIYSTAAVNVSSDRRLKRDIFEMDADKLAEFVDKLSVVSYNYTNDPENAQSRIGLIAQDVQEADSDLAKFFVSEGEDGMLGMTPADLVFPLIAAVQRLSAEIAELKAAK